jgi:C-terminal processing protease CtpA/Prc
MNLKFLVTTIVFIFSFVGNKVIAQSKYQKDFSEFWTDINDNYAYINEQNIDWKRVKEIYEPKVEKISNNQDFIILLENVLNELYNGHSSLDVNLNSSNRLIPSGMDLYVEILDDKFYIRDIRKGFGADLSGLKIGMEIKLFNGKPIDEQLNKFIPKYTNNPNKRMYQFAVDMLFAGTNDSERAITVDDNKKNKTYYPITYRNRDDLLYSKVLNLNTAYIKINNSLGNNNLISAFDNELDSLFQYKNLIIDLTETPNGGNTTVARSIMGRFINQTLPYQIHQIDEKEFDTKRYWIEYVTPRKKIYQGKVYILVGHWTGSMGEGIAIGFDGMKRAEIIGTRMAGLLGAISNFKLTETNIGFQLPTERLYHINGLPRENFLPQILTENIDQTLQKVKDIK